jgi:hypothetical protein
MHLTRLANCSNCVEVFYLNFQPLAVVKVLTSDFMLYEKEATAMRQQSDRH